MATLHLHHLVAVHPRGASLRARRPRRLKPIRPSRATELWYRGALVAVAGTLAEQGRQLMEKLRPTWPVVQDAGPRNWPEWLREVRAGWVKFSTHADELALSLSKRTLRDVDDRLAKEIQRSVGINVRAAFSVGGPIAHRMDDAMKANVALIRSIPDQYFERLETLVSSGWADGLRWETMAQEVENLAGVTETRAKVIARDQTAKLNSSFNQERQQQVGIEQYEWSTSQDERVRDSHADLDGKKFRWDEPGPLKGTIAGEPCHPGEDILCRCVALPLVDLDQVQSNVAAMAVEQEREAA